MLITHWQIQYSHCVSEGIWGRYWSINIISTTSLVLSSGETSRNWSLGILAEISSCASRMGVGCTPWAYMSGIWWNGFGGWWVEPRSDVGRGWISTGGTSKGCLWEEIPGTGTYWIHTSTKKSDPEYIECLLRDWHHDQGSACLISILMTILQTKCYCDPWCSQSSKRVPKIHTPSVDTLHDPWDCEYDGLHSHDQTCYLAQWALRKGDDQVGLIYSREHINNFFLKSLPLEVRDGGIQRCRARGQAVWGNGSCWRWRNLVARIWADPLVPKSDSWLAAGWKMGTSVPEQQGTGFAHCVNELDSETWTPVENAAPNRQLLDFGFVKDLEQSPATLCLDFWPIGLWANNKCCHK